MLTYRPQEWRIPAFAGMTVWWVQKLQDAIALGLLTPSTLRFGGTHFPKGEEEADYLLNLRLADGQAV